MRRSKLSFINNTEILGTIDLYQFVYISRVTFNGWSGFNILQDISKKALKNNSLDDVTGILCYGNGFFFQCVEGSEQALTNLKNRILADSRHKNLRLLDFSAITERRFTHWSLHCLILERDMVIDSKRKVFIPFLPYSWNTSEWQQFLNNLQCNYKKQKNIGETDIKLTKPSAIGLTLSKIFGQHQVFILIQSILGVLILLVVLWSVL